MGSASTLVVRLPGDVSGNAFRFSATDQTATGLANLTESTQVTWQTEYASDRNLDQRCVQTVRGK